jgi:hypothetical protein
MALGALLPENYLYISHLDEEFQFWQLPCTPETISDSMASTFNETSALGRSAPVFTYSKSGPRTVQVSLKFHRDMMDALNAGTSNVALKLGEDYVDSLIKALQAIAVPKYNLSNKAVEPPLVAMRLSQEVFIKGVVTSAIGLEYALPILSNGKYAQVSVSFTVSEVDPYDATTVFQNGSFRGVVKTLKTGMNITD